MRRTLRRPARLALLTSIALALTTSPAAPASATTSASSPAPLSDALAAAADALPPTTPYGAFVHFAGGDEDTRARVLTDHGLQVTSDFGSVDVAYAVGTLGAVLGLREQPGVTYLEADRALQYYGDTATWATRARVTRTDVAGGPYRDSTGRVLTGAGVGVAVVDSGIDGTHPDLAKRVGASYKVVCSTPGLISTRTGQCFGPVAFVETPFSDNTGGHGTHVAGIAVGDGTASKGTFQGVAPGATLFSYGVGEAISILYNAEAFQHMLDNYDAFTPRIRVVNNSYGDAAGTPHDPNSVFSKLTEQLVAKGVSVVFAAGNGDANGNGGTGADDRLSSMAKDPTPGVVTAANYNDGGSATREGTLNSSSSRGHAPRPETYPDLSAPGTSITAACNAALPVCRAEVVPTLAWAPHYATISGTSMASPHIAGAIALLYQARPGLDPAQVEDVLQDTAHKFAFGGAYRDDPQNAGGTTSHDKGAGLLDVTAALDALGVAADGRAPATAPALVVASPAEGATSDGSTALTLQGTAFDGVQPPTEPSTRTLAAGDQGDLGSPVPGAADLASLAVREATTGLRVTLGLRDVDEAGPSGVLLRLFQNVGGLPRTTSLNVSASSVTAPAYNLQTNNTVPTTVERDLAANTITVVLPFSDPDRTAPDTSLGDPRAGSLGTNVRVLSFLQSAVDQLPGGVGQAGTVQPEHAAPYVLVRPAAVLPPRATVTYAVDGGPEQAAALDGQSPDYAFSAVVPTSDLADGTHVLTTRLLLDGAVAATDTRSFTVARPRAVTSSIAVTAPADGATVTRSVVHVSGTSATDADAAVSRAVRLRVTGPDTASDVTALGTSSWTAPVDFGALPAGTYQLTAEILLDGAVAAVDTRTVLVPAPTVLVSCAPQALKFWQDQYGGGGKAAFTPEERDALSSEAAELSRGYFGNGGGVVTALYVKGRVTAELAAARQYAVLLLDLAGGRLSASYGRQVGLSGAEGLSPSAYDTARVGQTVAAAGDWVRAQLPGGDLSAAESVAGRLARGTGLDC